MTESGRVIAQVLVLDAMSLIHFGRADRLDVLRDLLVDKDCWTTQVVLEELSRGADAHPELTCVDVSDWLAVAPLDTFDARDSLGAGWPAVQMHGSSGAIVGGMPTGCA